MTSPMRAIVDTAAQNPKVQGSVAATMVSLGAMIDYIPDNIGKLAVLVGMVLSVMLIRVQAQNYRKTKLEGDAKELENAILKSKLEETQ